MTAVAQLAALWIGTGTILFGALVKIFRVLVRITSAIEDFPGLRDDVDQHEIRITALERPPLPRYDGLPFPANPPPPTGV